MSRSRAFASAPRAAALEWLVALAVFALLFAVYIHSPQRRFLDSKYALLTSHALLEHGDFDLSPYLHFDPALAAETGDAAVEGEDGAEDPPAVDDEAGAEAAAPAPPPRRLPYQLKAQRGRLLYLYSPGTALLSAPLLLPLRVAGYGPTGPDGYYDGARERELQGLVAAGLAAVTALLIFWVARRELPVGRAATVALVAGLGSGLWSAASRVTWTHTWSSLLIAAAWLELLRWEDGERRRGWLIGVLMVGLFWNRPTGAVIAAAVAIFVAIRHRRALPAVLLVGAAGLLAYFAYSLHYWGTLLPRYFRVGSHLLDDRPRAPLVFFELLISPGHGLFAFSPILLLVVWWLVRHGFAGERRAFALFSLAAFLAFVALYSRWGWGGTVGPRFLCDPVAVLAWLGAHGWRRAFEEWRAAPSASRRAAVTTVGALLVAASLAAHGGVAWDLRLLGLGPQPAARAPNRPKVPYLQRSYWRWHSLPQLELPAILDTLERRRQRRRRGALERGNVALAAAISPAADRLRSLEPGGPHR